jgi:hypothetical protein
LQDGEFYTDKCGCATSFTTHEYEKAVVNASIPPDKQLVFRQTFEFFTDCTLGQLPFSVDGEKNCHDEHFLKGKLANYATREH